MNSEDSDTAVDDIEKLYVELRELAYEDPVITKRRLQTILTGNPSLFVQLIESSADIRGSRFRQAAARALEGTILTPAQRDALSRWLAFETDEFTRSAISDTLDRSKLTTKQGSRSRTRPSEPVELEGTYRYVTSRIRHRVLNALPSAGMSIHRLRSELNVFEPSVVASLTPRLDQLYEQLSRLERLVVFDEDAAFFRQAPINLPVWLRDHHIKFTRAFGPIALTIHVFSEDVVIEATPYWLELVFTNLWKNSVDEVGRDCEVEVSITRNGRRIVVTLFDNGHGLLVDDVERAFKMRYSSKSQTRGRGHLEVQEAMNRIGGSASVVRTEKGFRVCLVFERASQ